MSGYDDAGCAVLARMQRGHWWYCGRDAVLMALVKWAGAGGNATDLGGGCGGWLRKLAESRLFENLALVDASPSAISLAVAELRRVRCSIYRGNLYDVAGASQDAVFLLDVIEHLDEDERAMKCAAGRLRKGGVLVVAVPAGKWLWSRYDERAGHRRRYSARELRRLGERVGLEVVRAGYFNFFMALPMWLSRRLVPTCGEDEPPAFFNRVAGWLFSLEAGLVTWCKFPFGASAYAVFRK
jgi:SAM-dependent methyltransferase